MTPFGGLRVLARSGQGLIGQSEELDELMSKILKDELTEGIVTKLQDDLIIGGDNQEDAARNYIHILHKFHLANLKVEPEKTNIFPDSCDVAGWIWKKGGFLEVSPHRKSSILTARQDQITKVRHLRSFIGLYKTLHMATPAISRVLAPLIANILTVWTLLTKLAGPLLPQQSLPGIQSIQPTGTMTQKTKMIHISDTLTLSLLITSFVKTLITKITPQILVLNISILARMN